MSYGNCPICGAKGKTRERRINGNDKCENGHTYPSKDVIPEGSNLALIPTEYTGPKRCDLCKFEKDAPCTGKNCSFVNDYACFEPKGEETTDTGCDTCQHWAAVKIGKFCPDCGQALNH